MAKSAEEAQADTTLLSNRIFASPRPRRLVSPIAGVSMLSALFVILPSFSWDAFVRAFLVIVLTVYGSAALTLAIQRALRGNSYLRRTTLQAFVDACTVCGFILVVALAELAAWIATGSAFEYSRPRLLFLGFAATAWLRHTVWIATSDHRHARTFPASIVTPVLGFVGVKTVWNTSISDDALFFLFLAVFLGAGVAFTAAVNLPLRHAFGANGLRLMRHLLQHMTEVNEDARRELEEFFDSIAVPAEVRAGALAFRAPYGNLVLLVASHAHPGPFGRVGGSDMPAKLRTALGDVCRNVMVPHGPSTHDSNPSTTRECVKIAKSVRDFLDGARAQQGGSRFARAAVGRAGVTAQMFGDVALVTASLAPNPTDDIDTPTGHAAIHAAKEAGAADCLFLDAHNSASLTEGMVRFGSEDSLAMIEATHKAVRAASERLATSVRVGFAEGPLGSAREGAGSQGLQVMAVEADGQRVAYILFDGNNMVPGLRDEILGAMKGPVEDAEVLTTDNHSVNARMGGYNPIGTHIERSRLVAKARELVDAAIADLRPAESVVGVGTIHGLRVFGHENTARLTTSVNATISILRPTAILTFGLALAVSLILLIGIA